MLDYKTGVVGAGRVGAGMATLMAGHGCWVTIVGLDEEDLKRCRAILEGNLEELVQACDGAEPCGDPQTLYPDDRSG